ncbi:hypothetical protein CTAM01_01093 [Colletotrichum tamarilloi]|uniref:Uncharacterized protein n=1 Tax=Colletotrichum tamarilloi TaxID=1209934 RepID=A0ABQ9RTW6_9PEZI|nr:hypothetical protein CTAM01_01093 [Colletotrichum tamarilloi]
MTIRVDYCPSCQGRRCTNCSVHYGRVR